MLLLSTRTKTYDSVPMRKLLHVLENTSINRNYIRTIKDMHNDQQSKINIRNQVSKNFKQLKNASRQFPFTDTI